MDYAKIWAEAEAAGRQAMKDFSAKYPDASRTHDGIYDSGACGFAWLTIRPARGPFVAWCKKQNEILTAKMTAERGRPYPQKDYGDNGYNGGWQLWGAGSRSYRGQSIDVKEVAALAFAKVLEQHGIEASMSSRLD